MRVSIEVFLLDNFVMDAGIVLLASAFCSLRPRYLIGTLVCLLGAVYALVAVWLLPILLVLPFKLLMGVALALALRFNNLSSFIRGAISVFMSAFLLGGLLMGLTYLFGGSMENGVLIGTINTRIALIGAVLMALFPRLIRHLRSTARLSSTLAEARVDMGRGLYEYKALIDTGNLLIEPISGLPVMLISNMPAVTDGFPVKFSSVGKSGELMCVRAKYAEVNVNGRWRAIDVMLAQAPTAIAHADAILGSAALPPDNLSLFKEETSLAPHNSLY